MSNDTNKENNSHFGIKFLLILIVIFLIIGKLTGYFDEYSKLSSSIPTSPEVSTPFVMHNYKMKLKSVNVEIKSGYYIHSGIVKNIGTEQIDQLKVVVTWQDKKHRDLSDRDEGAVESTPLFPGAESPFKVMTLEKQNLKYSILTFQTIDGQEIETERAPGASD